MRKIVNGLVLDGSGAPAWRADVAIDHDRIHAVGDLDALEAEDTLDASGCIVCPGFIDIHTHSDAYLLLEPEAPSKLYQGVTTEVVGNCGASAAPLYGAARMPSDWRVHTYPGSWQSVAEYRALLEEVVPGPNVVLLVGHNTLRAGVIGYEPRPASGPECRRMVWRLEQALAEGARGLSTGLVYNPGRFAEPEEVHALAQVVAQQEGIYASHMRSESSRLPEAIAETLTVGQATGVRVQISHLKAHGQANWHLLEPALAQIHAAQEAGQSVFADRYPYTASCTDLDIIFPEWVVAGGPDVLLARLRDPRCRSRLLAALREGHPDSYWASITIGSTAEAATRQFAGKPLCEVARRLDMHPAAAAIWLAEQDALRTAAFFHGMCEPNLLRVLAQPYVMIGSDASLRAPEGPLGQDWPHPRAYGTFPRFLRMALQGDTVPLAEAIRKMTSLPAEALRLKDRGLLRAGYAADIVVFDPATIRDCSAFDRPHALAEGIRDVLVNGVPALCQGRMTHQRQGRFLD